MPCYICKKRTPFFDTVFLIQSAYVLYFSSYLYASLSLTNLCLPVSFFYLSRSIYTWWNQLLTNLRSVMTYISFSCKYFSLCDPMKCFSQVSFSLLLFETVYRVFFYLYNRNQLSLLLGCLPNSFQTYYTFLLYLTNLFEVVINTGFVQQYPSLAIRSH